MNATAPESKDFRRFRESGMTAGSSRSIGGGFVATRDVLARGLIRLGATPNRVTVAGLVATAGRRPASS